MVLNKIKVPPGTEPEAIFPHSLVSLKPAGLWVNRAASEAPFPHPLVSLKQRKATSEPYGAAWISTPPVSLKQVISTEDIDPIYIVSTLSQLALNYDEGFMEGRY